MSRLQASKTFSISFRFRLATALAWAACLRWRMAALVMVLDLPLAILPKVWAALFTLVIAGCCPPPEHSVGATEGANRDLARERASVYPSLITFVVGVQPGE